MERATELELIDRIYAQHDAGTTTLAPAAITVPAERYVSADYYERERHQVFRTMPIALCLSVDIGVGDRFVADIGGVPVVVTRDTGGVLQGFVNVCRHRGATVVRESGAGERNFVCPFHGWVYAGDTGRLLGRPRSCGGFDAYDATSIALPSISVAEHHGVVLARADAEPLDAEAWLAGLGRDWASLGFNALTPFMRRATTWQANWKLLLDTYLESYHVPALHKSSLSADYVDGASPMDPFGPHNRMVVPQATLLAQRSSPRDEWQLLPNSVLQYFVAPNVVISNLFGYVMMWRLVADGPGVTTVHHALYTRHAVTTDAEREHYTRRFESAQTITRVEDFPESERIHRNLAAGTLAATTIGRNEAGMVHLHQMLAAAMR